MSEPSNLSDYWTSKGNIRVIASRVSVFGVHLTLALDPGMQIANITV